MFQARCKVVRDRNGRCRIPRSLPDFVHSPRVLRRKLSPLNCSASDYGHCTMLGTGARLVKLLNPSELIGCTALTHPRQETVREIDKRIARSDRTESNQIQLSQDCRSIPGPSREPERD